MNAPKIFLLTVLSFLGVSLNVMASNTTETWTSASGTTWNTGTFWSGGSVPNTSGTSTFTAVFDSTVQLPPSAISLGTGSITVASLTLQGGTGSLTITDSTDTLTLTSTAPLSVAAGQTLNMNVNTSFANSTSNSDAISLGSTSTLTFGGGDDDHDRHGLDKTDGRNDHHWLN